MNRVVTWGIGGLAFAGLVAALSSDGDELDDENPDDGLTTMTRKQTLYAKLGLLSQVEEDQRLFVMLVAYGETGGTWKSTAHNDTPSEVEASRDAWDGNPTLAAKIVAKGFTRDQVAIGSGGYGGRLVPYFCDDMLDAKLPVNPRGVFDPNLSIVSTIIACHKLQQWRQWRDGGGTVAALRGGFWWPAKMDDLPADRIAKYRRHAEAVHLPADFVDRELAEFPGPSQGAAMLATLKGAAIA